MGAQTQQQSQIQHVPAALRRHREHQISCCDMPPSRGIRGPLPLQRPPGEQGVVPLPLVAIKTRYLLHATALVTPCAQESHSGHGSALLREIQPWRQPAAQKLTHTSGSKTDADTHTSTDVCNSNFLQPARLVETSLAAGHQRPNLFKQESQPSTQTTEHAASHKSL